MGILYLVIMVTLTTTGQIFAKQASGGLVMSKPWTIVKNPYLFASFASIAIVPFFVNLALDHYELAFVFSFTGIQYITVPLAAYIFLHEKLQIKQLLGMLLIVTGVWLFA